MEKTTNQNLLLSKAAAHNILLFHLNVLKRFIYYPEDAPVVFKAAQDCALITLENAGELNSEVLDYVRKAPMNLFFEPCILFFEPCI